MINYIKYGTGASDGGGGWGELQRLEKGVSSKRRRL